MDIADEFFQIMHQAFGKSESKCRTALRKLATKSGIPTDEYFLAQLDSFVEQWQQKFTQR